MSQIYLTFPDGAKARGACRHHRPRRRQVDLALARQAHRGDSLDGKLADLAAPIKADAAIRFLAREDEQALALIRHDAAHVMAEAVQELYPGTQVTIGPAIENGFYYDFAREEPFTPEDLPKIEAKMREIVARDARFSCDGDGARRAMQLFADKGEIFKVELIDAIPEGDEISGSTLKATWLDLCRGPHLTSTGKVGKAFKLLKIAGAYWRGDYNRPMLQRIYGTALRDRKGARTPICIRSRRRRSAITAARPGDGPVPLPGRGARRSLLAPEGLVAVPGADRLYAPASAGWGYVEVNSPDLLDRALWELSGHWEKFREHMYIAETPTSASIAASR